MFESIYVAPDHQHKDTGVLDLFTETAIFIAAYMKKDIK